MVDALSLATDLGTGQPLEHALRSAVLAVRLGELAGAPDQDFADTYYVMGDDIEHRAAFFLIDATNRRKCSRSSSERALHGLSGRSLAPRKHVREPPLRE